MKRLALFGFMGLALGVTGCANPNLAGTTIVKTVPPGHALKLNHFHDMHEDCTPTGSVFLTITKPPEHGTADYRNASDYPVYPTSNPRSVCNQRPHPGVQVWYQPAPGFTGQDSVSFRVQWPEGNENRYTYVINVN
jgi:hypothetical protein